MKTRQALKKWTSGLMLTLVLLTFGIVNAGSSHPHDGFEEGPFEHPKLEQEQVYETEHFRIHYTLEGEDAVKSKDSNDNSIPDYVEDVANFAEEARSKQLALGWAEPPTDGDWGGNSLYDIYLLADIGGGGFTEGGLAETIVGDNPNSSAKEVNASFSYIGIGTGYDTEFSDKPREHLKTLLAHEYHHAIQFGYDGTEPLEWLWEATASWMEEQVYDEHNGSHDMLSSVFKSPDSCQVSYGGETRVEDEGHWYGLWIFLQHISETHGHDAVKAIWEEARSKDGYEALEAALARYNTTLDKTFKDFSVALLTRNFEEGKTFPTVRLEAKLDAAEFTATDGVGQMAADYLELDLKGTKTIKLAATDLNAIMVGINNKQASVIDFENNEATINADGFQKLYLIVLNPERTTHESSCQTKGYSLTINDSLHAPSSAVASKINNFVAPQVEALAEISDDWIEEEFVVNEGNSESIGAPAHLIPSYLPQSLELADIVKENHDGIESTVVLFMPRGYEETFLDIYAEQTTQPTLESLLDEWGYSDREKSLETIAKQRIHFETFAMDDSSTHHSAYFVKEGQVIIVSTNLPQIELRKVVASLL